jgi:hypothetical protein
MDEDGGITRDSLETIIEYGHQVVAVFDDGRQPDGFVPFAYTVGRTAKGRPELLIAGPLPMQHMGVILNDLATYDDENPLTTGIDLPPSTILSGMPVRIIAADPVAAEMNQALNLFGDEVTALQVLWPDKRGLLPGDHFCEVPPGIQPTFPVD